MADEKQEITWHIPDESQATSLRIRILQIVFAAIIYLVVLWVFGARAMRLPGLAALVPIVVLFLLFTWRSSRRSELDDDNIRLSKAGLSWKDPSGQSGEVPRDRICGFRIGLDPDTMRAIPALTLVLVGGFESQPVELHEPASPARVRQFLSDELGLNEEKLSDEQFARRLRQTLETAIDYEPRSDAGQLLRYSLIGPARQASGVWSVATIDGRGDVSYDPARCCFQVGGTTHSELSSVKELLRYVEEDVLPTSDENVRELLARAEADAIERDRRSLIADVENAGIYFESDEYGCWKLQGTRQRLLSVCDWIEAAGRELEEAPLGARPQTRTLGGDMMRMDLQVSQNLWTDGMTIYGPNKFFVDVARQLRESIALAGVDSVTAVPPSDQWRQAPPFVLHVKSDGFDPTAQIAAHV